jgi:membrane protein implicated in regulation of membrane protease activity
MAAELVTPMGTFPAAPAAADAPTVLLWLVGILVLALGVVVLLLWRKMLEGEARCRAENEKARAEATTARDRIEEIYRTAVKEIGDREEKLQQVVASNTEALREVKELGSGFYRALREARETRGGG